MLVGRRCSSPAPTTRPASRLDLNAGLPKRHPLAGEGGRTKGRNRDEPRRDSAAGRLGPGDRSSPAQPGDQRPGRNALGRTPRIGTRFDAKRNLVQLKSAIRGSASRRRGASGCSSRFSPCARGDRPRTRPVPGDRGPAWRPNHAGTAATVRHALRRRFFPARELIIGSFFFFFFFIKPLVRRQERQRFNHKGRHRHQDTKKMQKNE